MGCGLKLTPTTHYSTHNAQLIPNTHNRHNESDNKLVLKSYAKLNLYLEVLNKRKDSYHNLRTIFERISLSDKISIKKRRDNLITVSCDSREVPSNSLNLAYRAAKILQDKFKIKSGVSIGIEKRIPVGAGLGGGSSNAATVLLGLNKLWKLKLNRQQLAKLGAQLGSDVPFFVYEVKFARGLGRGDVIKPLSALSGVNLWHILVVPKIHVSTPYIYKKWDAQIHKKGRPGVLTRPVPNDKMLCLALKKKSLNSIALGLNNVLEKVTVKFYPEVTVVKEKLASCGVKSILMSGSGPAVFGIVASRKEAADLAAKLKAQHQDWRSFAIKNA